jgi:hypothetical protein
VCLGPLLLQQLHQRQLRLYIMMRGAVSKIAHRCLVSWYASMVAGKHVHVAAMQCSTHLALSGRCATVYNAATVARSCYASACWTAEIWVAGTLASTDRQCVSCATATSAIKDPSRHHSPCSVHIILPSHPVGAHGMRATETADAPAGPNTTALKTSQHDHTQAASFRPSAYTHMV